MDESERLAGKENQLAILDDKVEALTSFLEDAPPNDSMDRVIATLESLFEEAEVGADNKILPKGIVTLATIHKAKGGEWPRVFLLDSGVLGFTQRRSKGKMVDLLPWEIQQKRNLLYVGITRAQNHLTYISSEAFRALP